MTDGAHLNISADDAMGTIVGGKEQPEPMTNAEFEDMIRSAPIMSAEDSEFDYGNCSNACARIVLEAYEDYPQLQDLPEKHELLRDATGDIDWNNPIRLNITLYDVLKQLHDENSNEYRFVLSELTGFMWGWAVNAARKIRGLDPVPNPALLTISTTVDDEAKP